MSETTEISGNARGLWKLAADNRSNPLYTLAIVDDPNFDSDFTLEDSLEDTFENSFLFRVPPRVYNLSEPFTTNIQPAQNGGVIVDSQGILLRDITIEGTFGLRPNKKYDPDSAFKREARGLYDSVNNLVDSFKKTFGLSSTSSVDPITKLPNGEVTGWEEFMKLRNFIRSYSEYCKDVNKAYKTYMVFTNVFENESWFVEPIAFRSHRSVPGDRFTFTYALDMKAIKKATTKISIPEDVVIGDQRSWINKIFSKIQDVIALANNAIAVVEAGIDFVNGILNNALEVINQVKNLIYQASNLIAGVQQVINFPKRVVSEINSLCVAASYLADQAVALYWSFGQDRPINNLYNLNSPISNLPITADMMQTSQALKDIVRTTNFFLALPDKMYQMVPLNTKTTNIMKLYSERDRITRDNTGKLVNETVTQQLSLSDPTNINRKVPDGFGQAVVRQGDTIKTLAQRLLGDSAQWKTLVLINNLTYPYVYGNGRPGVDAPTLGILFPGDLILYPMESSSTGYNNVSTGVKTGQKLELTELENQMGVDIKLDEDNDLVVNSNGDLDMIYGYDNAEQALRIKFFTPSGELKLHQWFGLTFPTGTKYQEYKLVRFLEMARRLVLSDSRFSDLKNTQVAVNGDIFAFSADVSIANTDNTTKFTALVKQRG